MALTTRMALLGTLAFAVMLLTGCMKFGLDLAVAPDSSTSARMTIGIDKSLDEMGETSTGSPFDELTSGEDAERWTVREYTEGNWKMSEAIGHAGPGEALFTGEDAPAMQVQTSHRRLTTRYMLSLAVPTPDIPTPPAEEMTEGLEQVVGSVMAGLEIKFVLSGPGRVVATTGQDMGRGRAEWKLGMKSLQGGRLPDFKLTTEMPNWTNIGRLADQIATQSGQFDAGSELATGLERGLLPNPPSNESGPKLSADDYGKLLEIIARLDAGLWPEATAKVMAKAGLADDYVTSAQVQAAHARLLKADLAGLVETAAATAAVEALSGK